jgi:hypothetical protein
VPDALLIAHTVRSLVVTEVHMDIRSLCSLPVLLTVFVLVSFTQDSAFAASKKDFKIC